MYTIMLSQGKFTHKDALSFPFEERGSQFGDGVYEVIRIYHGKPYLLNEHIKRLYRSLEAIHIDLEIAKEELLFLLIELIKRNNMKQDGLIYLQITRGSAPRLHQFPQNTKPNMYAYVQNLDRTTDLYEQGVGMITMSDERWENCHIKSLNLLPNILGKQAAIEQNCYEPIFHIDGTVTEGCSSNIFLIKDEIIYTHPSTKRILKGCVRGAVERFAKVLHIPFIEESFTVDELFTADELFLTSSISEIMPIVSVDGETIADGVPGDISRKLQKAYEIDAQLIKS